MMGNYWPVVYPEAVTHDARAAPQPAGRDLIEQVLARMRAHGGRVTQARRLLLAALVENPGHSSAEELAACVQARAPDMVAYFTKPAGGEVKTGDVLRNPAYAQTLRALADGLGAGA